MITIKIRFLFLYLFIFSSLIVSGCNVGESYIIQSKEKDKYVLYVVGDELDGSEFDQEGIDYVSEITNANSLEAAQKNLPSIEFVEDRPNYLAFDHKGLRHQTTSLDDLIGFLKKNPL